MPTQNIGLNIVKYRGTMSKEDFLKKLNMLEQIIKSDPSKKLQQGFRNLLTEQENYFDTHRTDRTEFSEAEINLFSSRLSALRSEPSSSSSQTDVAHTFAGGEHDYSVAYPAPGFNSSTSAVPTPHITALGRSYSPDPEGWELIDYSF